MDELEPESKALLDALGRAEAPTDGQLKSLLARVEVSAAASSAAAAGTGVGLGTKVGLGLGLAAAIVVGAGYLQTGSPASTPPEPVAMQDPQPESAPTPSSAVPSPAPADPVTEVDLDPAAAPAPAPARTKSDPPRRRARRTAPKPGSQDRAAMPGGPGGPDGPGGVDAEVQLLGRIRRALAAGDPTRALHLADEHARQFSRGKFAGEREVLAVRALCAQGKSTRARARADAFARKNPGSHLVGRIRAACPPAGG